MSLFMPENNIRLRSYSNVQATVALLRPKLITGFGVPRHCPESDAVQLIHTILAERDLFLDPYPSIFLEASFPTAHLTSPI